MVIGFSVNANIIQSSELSLMDIAEGMKNGKYQYYPVAKEFNNASDYPFIFGTSLKPGTPLPKIVDPRALLDAAEKEQEITVVNNGDKWHLCFPLLEEIAIQNHISCDSLMSYLAVNWADEDKNPFSDVVEMSEEIIEAIEATIEDDVEEIVSPIGGEIIIDVPELVEIVEEVMIDNSITLEELAVILANNGYDLSYYDYGGDVLQNALDDDGLEIDLENGIVKDAEGNILQ